MHSDAARQDEKEGIMIYHVPRWAIAIPALLWITPGGPAFAASTSMACNDSKVITVSTGSPSGSCTQSADSTGSFFTCMDGDNVTSGGCGSDGKAVCGSSKGAGIIMQTVRKPPKRPVRRPRSAAGAVQGYRGRYRGGPVVEPEPCEGREALLCGRYGDCQWVCD